MKVFKSELKDLVGSALSQACRAPCSEAENRPSHCCARCLQGRHRAAASDVDAEASAAPCPSPPQRASDLSRSSLGASWRLRSRLRSLRCRRFQG